MKVFLKLAAPSLAFAAALTARAQFGTPADLTFGRIAAVTLPIYFAAVAQTNDTAARTIYQTSTSPTVSANWLYLIGESHQLGSQAATPSAVSNINGCVATLLSSTNGIGGFNIEVLSVWFFQTNLNVAGGAWCVGFTGNQLECNIAVVAITNMSLTSPWVQTNGWAQTSLGVICSNRFTALPAKAANVVAVFAGNFSNPFAGSVTNLSLITPTEIYDIGNSTPSTGLWAGVATNLPASQTYQILMGASVAWETIGVEIAP